MDPVDAQPRLLNVEIAYSPSAGQVRRLTLRLLAGATVADAIAQSGWELPAALRVGIWGRPRALGDVLRDRDRIELCRPLTVDPKEARRQRYRKHRDAGKAGKA
jgi:putative ubiquitin-RnfH superfamily antitoxin RatB of RatAB toxin-antitoxin module